MTSERISGGPSRIWSYDEILTYHEYENSSDVLSIPIDIRERHLTKETESAWIQAIGSSVQIIIPSIRDDIAMRIPVCEWNMTGPQTRKLTGANRGLLKLGKDFSPIIEKHPDEGRGDYEPDGEVFVEIEILSMEVPIP